MSKKELFSRQRIDIGFSEADSHFSFTVGRVKYSKAHEPLKEHVHKNAMEIVCIEKGSQVYTVGGIDHLVGSGRIFVTFPDEKHSTGHYPEDKSLLYYIIIDLDCHQAGSLGFREEAVTLVEALRSIKSRVFQGSPDIRHCLDRMILAYFSGGPFRKTVIRNMISEILIKIVECARQGDNLDTLHMKNVLEHIDRNISEGLTVEQLAKIAGLSVGRFKVNFRKYVGIPPGEYILRRKLDRAKMLLKEQNRTVTDVAHELSFSSSQYFSTVFKRFTFMSPNEYKRQNK